MNPHPTELDLDSLKTSLERAFAENTNTVEQLRPFQHQLKAAGLDSDVEDIYDQAICNLGLDSSILLRVRSDMGGGRDFRSEEAFILGDENRLVNILQLKNIVFDETRLREVMRVARIFYGGRVRKDGSLFYTHALKTALLFAGYGDVIKLDKVIIALLHDVIEIGMTTRESVRNELEKLQIKDADGLSALVADVAPSPAERAAIKAGDVSTYFERITNSGLLPVILAEKLQNIHDGRRLFLTRPDDERNYVSTRLKPSVIRQYLQTGAATELKITLLTDYIDLLYLTEIYDPSLDACVGSFLKSDKVSDTVETIGLEVRLDRFRAFQKFDHELNRILEKHELNRDSAAYAHVRKAVTDAILLLTTAELNMVFRKASQSSVVEAAIDRFMNRVRQYGSADSRRVINSEYCGILLNIIGYEILEKAAQSQRWVEGEEEVADILKSLPREGGIEEIWKACDEHIVTFGIVSDAVYLLLEGDAIFFTPSDRERHGGRIGPGNTISTTSVRKNRAASATVKAGMKGAKLLKIPRIDYLDICQADSKLMTLLEKTSGLRTAARIRGEKAPIASLDLVQSNTLREIIDVQEGWSNGTFDLLGNRTKRRVVFKNKTSNQHLSFAEVSALISGFEAAHLSKVSDQRRFVEEAGAESLSLLSKLRALMIRGELVIEIDDQCLSKSERGDKKRVGKFMRQLEEMLTVETARGREHRQAIQLTLYENYERRHLKHPASIFQDQAASGQAFVARVQSASLEFIDEAIGKGFLYASNDPDNGVVKEFVTELIDLVADGYAENVARYPESFMTLIFSTLESLIVQQGGSLLRDEEAYWSFGTGSNRLRGSNGVMHIIANWRRGKAILEAMKGSFKESAKWQAVFCFADAWHDSNAGSVQEANTGSRFWSTGQSPDLKAGHGFAAVKYLEELHDDLHNIFGAGGIELIERLAARHDNGFLIFDTDEDVLFSIIGISDNAASEEKVIDAFTKVPGNERVAIQLYRTLADFESQRKEINGEDADEAMAPLRLQMETNIAEAFKNGRINAIQNNAYLSAIRNDLTLYVGKGALEALGMQKSVSSVEFTGGVLTVRHTRSPLYAALLPYLGESLLQSRIYDCVKEYKVYLPELREDSDLAEQCLSYQTGLNGDGRVQSVVFKIDDAAPGTRPLEYAERVYAALKDA